LLAPDSRRESSGYRTLCQRAPLSLALCPGGAQQRGLSIATRTGRSRAGRLRRGAGLFYARIVQRSDERRLAALTRYFSALTARPSVGRVIDEARAYRHLFPLQWPEYV
jgi:hypothetical protein